MPVLARNGNIQAEFTCFEWDRMPVGHNGYTEIYRDCDADKAMEGRPFAGKPESRHFYEVMYRYFQTCGFTQSWEPGSPDWSGAVLTVQENFGTLPENPAFRWLFMNGQKLREVVNYTVQHNPATHDTITLLQPEPEANYELVFWFLPVPTNPGA